MGEASVFRKVCGKRKRHGERELCHAFGRVTGHVAKRYAVFGAIRRVYIIITRGGNANKAQVFRRGEVFAVELYFVYYKDFGVFYARGHVFGRCFFVFRSFAERAKRGKVYIRAERSFVKYCNFHCG